jgi:hypothetical protein
MEIIFDGKLCDITHISHFPVLFEKIVLKSFNKTRYSFVGKIEKKIGFNFWVLGIWRGKPHFEILKVYQRSFGYFYGTWFI